MKNMFASIKNFNPKDDIGAVINYYCLNKELTEDDKNWIAKDIFGLKDYKELDTKLGRINKN